MNMPNVTLLARKIKSPDERPDWHTDAPAARAASAVPDSIAAQEGELPPVRVFVADNDAKGREGDRWLRSLPHYRFPISSTVVDEPGISAVRNAILAEARSSGAEFVAMIDDDETVAPHWLARLLDAQRRYGADVVGGPVARILPETLPEWMQTGFFPDRGFSEGPIDQLDASGNLLISCEALEHAGWPKFDHSFGLTGGEDTEFLYRLKKMDFSFAWSGEAEATEMVPLSRCTLPWFVRRHFRIGNSAERLQRNGLIGSRRSWAVRIVLGWPLLLPLTLPRRTRLKALRRLAYGAGMLSSALGYRYREYAERHE